MRRSLVVVAVALALAGGCGDDAKDEADDLEPGDCVAGDLRAKDDAVEVVGCDDDHVVQAMGSFEAQDGDYPGDEELAALGYERCQGDVFEAFVGVPYVESATVYASWLAPDEDAWADGDRTIVCLAHTQDHEPTTGSFEGSGRAE